MQLKDFFDSLFSAEYQEELRIFEGRKWDDIYKYIPFKEALTEPFANAEVLDVSSDKGGRRWCILIEPPEVH